MKESNDRKAVLEADPDAKNSINEEDCGVTAEEAEAYADGDSNDYLKKADEVSSEGDLNEGIGAADEVSPERGSDGATKNEDKDITVSATDYEALMRSDLTELQRLFPHLLDKRSITELDDPLRYAKLRDLGLSPKEAYLASAKIESVYDNRSHIIPSYSRAAGSSSSSLSGDELEKARFIFSELSDREIQKLYKKVTQ
jgi:hypothetical protein